MATVSKDPVQNLADLALFISMDVHHAIAASFVTFVADAWFHQFARAEAEKRFRTHPANNIVYAGLKALEERSIVRVYETLKDEHKLHPTTAAVRRKDDLRLHRTALSHPMTVEWRDAKMQAFAEADRDGYDFKPGLVWDLQRSINEELRQHGRELHNETVPVTYDMAVSLSAILNLTRLPTYEIPTQEQFFAYLKTEAPKYQAILEKHPDGARDLQKEKARAERRRLRREKWAAMAKSAPKP